MGELDDLATTWRSWATFPLSNGTVVQLSVRGEMGEAEKAELSRILVMISDGCAEPADD